MSQNNTRVFVHMSKGEYFTDKSLKSKRLSDSSRKRLALLTYKDLVYVHWVHGFHFDTICIGKRERETK